jgi:hypothetical protein
MKPRINSATDPSMLTLCDSHCSDLPAPEVAAEVSVESEDPQGVRDIDDVEGINLCIYRTTSTIHSHTHRMRFS